MFGFCVRILGLGYRGGLTRLVVLVLLSLLPGICVDYIWGDFGFG